MTAPYDAKRETYAAGVTVKSDQLNKIQDDISDLVGAEKVTVTGFGSGEGVGGAQAAWYWDATNPEYGQIHDNTGSLYYWIPARADARLTQVLVKFQNNNSPTAPTISLYKVNHEFDAGTTAPTKSTLDSDTGATSSGWQLVTLTAGPDDLTEEHSYLVEVTASVGDRVAGIRAEFERMLTVTNP